MDELRELRGRLKSCLESILNLEEDFRRRGQEAFVHDELFFLKTYAGRVETLPLLDEQEVSRLENITAKILAEFGECGPSSDHRYQVLQ